MNINATFFAELLAFCIFVFITYRYIWPSMENLLEDRRKEISDGLEAASHPSQRKLEEANKESATILDGAKAEASSLINQANSRADQIVDEAKEQAVEEAKKIKLSAEADIEQSANKAKDGLRDEVAALVIAGAQKILDKEINAKANKDIIDSLIKKI